MEIARTLPLKHLLRYHEQNYTLLRPHESPPAFHNCSGFLNFDSRFECGNLLCAYQSLSSPVEYHLFMENDTNRFGYNQWFYFSLAGALPGNTYRFKVLNFVRNYSFSANRRLSISQACDQPPFLLRNIRRVGMDGAETRTM
jgi:hypothetical protein